MLTDLIWNVLMWDTAAHSWLLAGTFTFIDHNVIATTSGSGNQDLMNTNVGGSHCTQCYRVIVYSPRHYTIHFQFNVL